MFRSTLVLLLWLLLQVVGNVDKAGPSRIFLVEVEFVASRRVAGADKEPEGTEVVTCEESDRH